MIDWMSDYWWLSLIALLIGIGTAYWMWCVDCPGDVRDRALDAEPATKVKTEPPKPLEPKKPEITPARPMNFKDAPGFDTGKAAGVAAAAGAAGLAAAAVAKTSEPVKAPEPPKAPPPKVEPAPAPKPAPVAKVAKPKAVKAAPVKTAAVKPAAKAKAEPVKKAATKAPAKTATETKKPAAKTVTKSAAPVAKKAEPVKKAATKAAPAKAPVKKTESKVAAKPKADPKPKAAPKPKAEAKPKVAAKPKAAPAKKAAAATGVVALGAVMNEAGKPKIRGAGSGKPDDLNLIKGVGPKLNTLLISLGVTRFAQIASWTKDEIAEVDQYLGNFTGRIARDNWVDQAGYLAKGDVAGFSKKYGELGSEIKK